MRTFYLSPSGNDGADGQTTASPWRSLARANQQVFTPGDRLLLEGGASFPGMLYLDSRDGGSASAPVIVGSYGTGRATIAATGNAGIFVYDTAGLLVRDLSVVGDATAYHSKGGVSFYNDLPGGRKLAGVTVTNVEVSGFKNGIEIGGANGDSGFSNVAVTDSVLHDNMEAGFVTYGPSFDAAWPTYAHAGVSVLRVQAFRNVGDLKNTVRNTGSGIILGSVRGGAVAWSSAHDNGSACPAPEGPVGIWTYDSTGVVISHNVSYHNHTGGPADGDGFDLDQNVSSSILEYNLSYENDGAGYLLYTGAANAAHANNIVRFNISSNDARENSWYGAFTVVGRIAAAEIYDNTAVVAASTTGSPPALRLGAGLSGVTLRNNIFFADDSGAVLSAPALRTAEVLLQGNDYYSTGVPLALVWGNESYSALSSWRAATGQEYIGTTATGLSVAPQLRNTQAPSAVTDPADLTGARGFGLGSASPLLGRGLDLTTLFGLVPGPTDFFGTALPAGRLTADVGAHQPSV